MPLSVGAKLGHYEVLSLLGQGGMGEVYRARDPKLKRDVALKVLPAAFSTDPERIGRFQREAEVLASLDYPNIAPIYGMVESEGVLALTLALIEGPTLGDMIATGPLPLEEAVSVARQIIAALEYAHDRGVIHRDLKPANVKVTPEGAVKVLDFGLAKVLDDEQPAVSGANSPTLTLGHTRAGVILGTAAYMSPEQAVGKTADRRSDIFSFGSVLFEILTGQRAFGGDSAGETLVAVAKDEPDWSKLPSETPRAMEKLLRRCLVKDRKQRLQAIGEARILLESPEEPPQVEVPAVARPSRRPVIWMASTAVMFLALAALASIHFRETPPVEHTLRYTVVPPENSSVHSFAISPDGRMIVIAAVVNGKRQLWLRPLDALQSQPMPTTDDATYPFWSPDSHYIAFFADGKLKKVAAGGGPSQTLCSASGGRSGSWNREDEIVFSPYGGAGNSIQKVPAAGGAPANVTDTNGDHRFPVFLPDGRHFLYVLTAANEKNGLYVASLDGHENRRVLADESRGVFSPSVPGSTAGHLLFVRDNILMAQPFNGASAQTSGDAFPVAERVSFANVTAFAPVAVSEGGTMVYWTGGSASAGGFQQLVWYDRAGKLLEPVGAPGSIINPALSPDEKTVAFSRTTGGNSDIWLRDLARSTEIRLTSDASTNSAPFWSPKGDRIVFRSNRGGHAGDLYQKLVNGTGQDEPLLSTPNAKMVDQWSRDGRYIVYAELDAKTKADLWVLPVGEGAPADRKPIPFLKTEFNEYFGQLSPDSRWMAYASEESGQREVYVRPFPASGGVWRISTAGGTQPRWRADGKELFYVAPDGKMTSVAIRMSTGPKPSFEAATPIPLFDTHSSAITNVYFNYDVTADGKRFIVDTLGNALTPSSATPPLTVVVNWNTGFKK